MPRMKTTSILGDLRRMDGFARVLFVAALLFQLIIGAPLHALRMAQDDALRALGLGVICSQYGSTGDPSQPSRQANDECCVAGFCQSAAAPADLAAASEIEPDFTVVHVARPASRQLGPNAARFPSDLVARAPPGSGLLHF